MKGYAFAFGHPLLYRLGQRASAAGAKAVTQATGIDPMEKLPPPISGWTDYRDFPAFADRSFHDWWEQNRKNKHEPDAAD